MTPHTSIRSFAEAALSAAYLLDHACECEQREAQDHQVEAADELVDRIFAATGIDRPLLGKLIKAGVLP